jgi:hypothetical protein
MAAMAKEIVSWRKSLSAQAVEPDKPEPELMPCKLG